VAWCEMVNQGTISVLVSKIYVNVNKTMKNYIFLFVLTFLILPVSALKSQDASSSSNLNLSLFDGSNFSYSLDDAEASPFADEFDIIGISGGRHYLKVTAETNRMKKTQEILFSDYVDIPAGYSLFAVIDEYGKFYIYKKIASLNYHKHKKWIPDETQKEKNDCKNKVMADADFDKLKSNVESKSFEQTKLDMIKQAVDMNYLTSAQLKELLKLFSFEDSKVTAAEYAYIKICDKQNFSTVYDVFSFESSISNIIEYIKNK
jgi:hypothetical protein